MTKPKRGRPFKPAPEHVSGCGIATTLRPADAARVRELAENEGLPVSMWVRRVLLRTIANSPAQS